MTDPTSPQPQPTQITAPMDRPVPARRRARPAADAGHDPVDPISSPLVGVSMLASNTNVGERSATRPARGRRGPEPTVQLNTRVSQDVRSLVDDVVADTGQSLRDVVEHALRHTYGTKG